MNMNTRAIFALIQSNQEQKFERFAFRCLTFFNLMDELKAIVKWQQKK